MVESSSNFYLNNDRVLSDEKKVYVVECDEDVKGYFLSKEEAQDYLERLFLQEYTTRLPFEHLRVVRNETENTTEVTVYASMRDACFTIERLHTRLVCRPIENS